MVQSKRAVHRNGRVYLFKTIFVSLGWKIKELNKGTIPGYVLRRIVVLPRRGRVRGNQLVFNNIGRRTDTMHVLMIYILHSARICRLRTNIYRKNTSVFRSKRRASVRK